MDKSEKRFERDIESFLISPEGGYTQFCGQDAEGNWVHTRQHDVSKCIYMDVLCEFIAKTQPKEWAKYTKYYGASAADKLYHRLETTISNQGLLYVLRNGIEDMGCKLKVCFFKPESNLNPLAIELYEANLKCFALNERCTQVDGYPVRRGMCFPIDKNTMYLFTHGIAPSVISPNRRYFQGGKSVPLPLKVVKHYGSGDMAQIATEILGLSKMNWNSFGLYSKLPCTIESSNEIARIGWLLSQFEGTLYDYRYFM